jgi:magnesium-dependent phosphatase 1
LDCGKDVIAPYTLYHDGCILDYRGRLANPYSDVQNIIAYLVDSGITIIFASRNPDRNSIEALLKTIPINCQNKNIKTMWDVLASPTLLHAYSSDRIGNGKDKHFAAIYKNTLIPFSRMVFYDDQPGNINAAMAQGTTSILVNKSEGLTWQKFNDGINEWRSKNIPNVSLDDLGRSSKDVEYISI